MTKEEQDGFKMKIFLPKRNPASHKGSYGKCLILAGAEGMAGAAYFAALSAYRSGTGLGQLWDITKLNPGGDYSFCSKREGAF